MLLEHLDEQQATDWERIGRFIVIAPSGNRYLIQSEGSQVRNVDNRTAYCLQPTGTVPKADTALAHKLWLEADEDGFLEAANAFPPLNEWGGALSQNCRCAIDVEIEYQMRDARQQHDLRLEALHRDFQSRLADEERRFHNEIAHIQQQARERNADA